jgi:hypothetical protein
VLVREAIYRKPAVGLITIFSRQYPRRTDQQGMGAKWAVLDVGVIASGLHDRNARWFNGTHYLPSHHRRRYLLARGQADVKAVLGDRDDTTKAADVPLGITTGRPR